MTTNPTIAHIDATTRKAAKQQALWAAKICKVDGGYLAFATLTDFAVWKGQK